MPKRKVIVTCDCGEQFEEDESGELIGNVEKGAWYCERAELHEAFLERASVTWYYERSVECGACYRALKRETTVRYSSPPKLSEEDV